METTVTTSPFPLYLSDEQYPTPELLPHYTASANPPAATRSLHRTLTYNRAPHVVPSTTPLSSVGEKDEKADKDQGSMAAKEEHVKDQYPQVSCRDKGVQVNLTSMKSLHGSVHAPPTGVARISPLADHQRHLPPAPVDGADITLVACNDSGKHERPGVSNIPNFGDNKEEGMWW